MYKKALIAEDFDSINIALLQTLESFGIQVIEHVKYCDEALLRIKKGLQDSEPFDLLITDLSFEKDYRECTIKDGSELIQAIKKIQQNINIIVYSVEDRTFIIKSLFENGQINSYVHKGRNSLSHLKTAMETNLYGKTFISPELSYALTIKTVKEIDTFDIALLTNISLGLSIVEMEQKLKNDGIQPNSKSYIEKKISKLKDYFKANNNAHLVKIAKDLGII